MRAIILAAGRGSRMRHMTDDRPKCLVELAGEPLLQWQLAVLREAGVHDVTIVTGYQSVMLSGYGAETVFNPEWATSNMVVSLLAAQSLVSEPTLVSYSDIVYDADIVRTLLAAQGSLALAYDRDWLQLWQRRFVDPLQDAESFRTDSDDSVVEIGRRVDDVNEIQGQYMGLLRIDEIAMGWIAEFVRDNPDRRDKLDMTALLSGLIEGGRRIQGVAISGGWCETDDTDDLGVAEAMVKEGRLRFPKP